MLNNNTIARIPRAFIFAAVALVICIGIGRLVVAMSQLPPHVTRVNGTPTPDPGYVWIGDPVHDLRVKWSPGAVNPLHPHVAAGQVEATWDPLPGYNWNSPSDRKDLAVSWQPGQLHPDHAHVVAGESEGSWDAQPGYEIVDGPGLTAVWRPGTGYPGHAHVDASETEGQFHPAPGYVWTDKDKLQVTWQPGIELIGHPHVVADDTEGQCDPAPGYAWTDRDRWLVVWQPGLELTGHPHVVASDTEGQCRPDDGYVWSDKDKLEVTLQSADPGSEKNSRMLGDLAIAFFAGALSKPQEQDDDAAKYFGRPLAKTMQDAALDDFKKGLEDHK